MIKERWAILAAILLPLAVMSLSTGCKRNYPLNPVGVNTPTNTPGSPTRTPTPTYTRTFTITHTSQYSFTFTNTRTETLTPTVTNSPTVTNTFTPIPSPAMIDNLEDGDTTINAIANLASPPGSWFTEGDPGCTISPATVGTPGVAASAYAIQLTGTGCNTFGAVIALNFESEVGRTMDLSSSGITGLRFSIRRISGSVASIRYSVVDAPNADAARGGYCGGAATCGAYYGKDLTVGTTWQTEMVFFSEMNRPSWYTGGAMFAQFDIWEVIGLQWQANAPSGQDFALEIDNVEFIYDTPPPTPTPDCHLVDDVEDNNNQIKVFLAPACGSDGARTRGGFWYAFHDNTGETWPAPGTTFEQSAGGAVSTSFAARLTGTGHTDWGSGLGINLTEPKAFYDLTVGGQYTGVRYYAKVGAGSTTSIRFKIPDIHTEPAGGICQTAAPADCPNWDDTKQYNNCCYDDFGVVLTLTNDWVLQTIPFASLTQENFGYIPPTGFDPTQITALQWQAGPGVDFDLWVDEVELY